jgi:hypothetical protein
MLTTVLSLMLGLLALAGIAALHWLFIRSAIVSALKRFKSKYESKP